MSKILLTCGKMSVGGIQKALLSFANELCQNGYEITVVLDDISGELTSQFSEGIRVKLLDDKACAIHTVSLSEKKQIFKYVLKKPFFGIELFKRFLKKNNNISSKEVAQILWKYLSANIAPYQEDFDYAISFAGLMGVWNEYVIDKVKAKHKICWIHGNYENTSVRSKNELYYLNQFDNIVTVTETNTKLVQKYVDEPKRVITIHNTMNVDVILQKAEEKIALVKKAFTFATMSRLNYGKGIEQGLEATKILKQKGIQFEWYILGDGPLKENYIEKAVELGVDEYVHFLGNIRNPYPYLVFSDMYFHPSLGEGRSIAIDEAKILCKPVIATNYPTVYDQICDGIDGLIVNPIPESLAEGLEKISSSKELRHSIEEHLLISRAQYHGFNIYKSFVELTQKSKEVK